MNIGGMSGKMLRLKNGEKCVSNWNPHLGIFEANLFFGGVYDLNNCAGT